MDFIMERVKTPKALLLAAQTVCAMLVFVCMSNQKAGLYGPNLETCERCNMGGVCLTERGAPRGQGCGYTSFSQFQYLCAVGVMWWLGSTALLALNLLGRSPPPMTEFLIYVIFDLFSFSGACAAASTCNDDPIVDDFRVCTGAHNARTSCTFAFVLWGLLSVSCWMTFRDWKSHQYEGLPEPVAFGLQTTLTPLGGMSGFRSHPPHAYPPGHVVSVPASTQTYN